MKITQSFGVNLRTMQMIQEGMNESIGDNEFMVIQKLHSVLTRKELPNLWLRPRS